MCNKESPLQPKSAASPLFQKGAGFANISYIPYLLRWKDISAENRDVPLLEPPFEKGGEEIRLGFQGGFDEIPRLRSEWHGAAECETPSVIPYGMPPANAQAKLSPSRGRQIAVREKCVYDTEWRYYSLAL